MTIASLAGQSVVGQFTDTAWWPGHFEITQGWGPSDYSGEPEGHGYSHWHAGADIGAPCGTVITLPQGIASATVRHVDNPGGYGTALVVTIGGYDVWLGHLASRLAQPGQVRAGQHLATSNNTGNSTGCHVHFEVRPKGARYGTDIDPTGWLLDPARAAGLYSGPLGTIKGAPAYGPGSADPRASTAANQDPIAAALAAAFQPVADSISSAEEQFVAAFVGTAQTALGAVVMLGGAGAVAAGWRGQSLGALGRGAVASVRRGQAQRAGAEVQRQRSAQGALAEEARTARETRAAQTGERRYAIAAYRAGLVSKAETQRRLGERIAATGRRRARPAAASVPAKGASSKPRVLPAIVGYNAQADQVRASRIKGSRAPRVA